MTALHEPSRPSQAELNQAELNQMSHDEKSALIMRMFDIADALQKHLEEIEQRVAKKPQRRQ